MWCTSHGNGRIVFIDYWDKEAHCKFQGGEGMCIPFDEIYGKWTDKFGGMWYLEDL